VKERKKYMISITQLPCCYPTDIPEHRTYPPKVLCVSKKGFDVGHHPNFVCIHAINRPFWLWILEAEVHGVIDNLIVQRNIQQV